MEKTVLKILNENFDVPLGAEDSTDLRQYLTDSIDVGELVAMLNQELELKIELADFKDIYTIRQVMELIKKKDES